MSVAAPAGLREGLRGGGSFGLSREDSFTLVPSDEGALLLAYTVKSLG